MTDRVVLRPGQMDDYPDIIAVWRSSVDASHGFVEPQDLLEIERELIPTHLPATTLTIASVDGRTVAFSGISGDKLDMLFVHNDVRGQGIGTKLLAKAIDDGARELDVNEANGDSVDYYLRRGFTIANRREVDDHGRPYPVLTMRVSPLTSGIDR